MKEDQPYSDRPQMVRIKGGTFKMGDQFGDGCKEERPVHEVTLSSYYLSRNLVTFESYDEYWKTTNRRFRWDHGWGRGQRPAVNLTWYDAIAYCNWLSEKEFLNLVYEVKGAMIRVYWGSDGYRLPTEAEWEYAARSRGQKEKWAGTNEENELARYAHYGRDKYEGTQVIQSYQPNALGLYDMSGNALEWCWDYYDAKYYKNGKEKVNPRGPFYGRERVLRGGNWGFRPEGCRTTFRYYFRPDYHGFGIGFRLARSAR